MSMMGRSLIAAAAVLVAATAEGRTLNFSGYDWNVKNFTSKVGPGPNYFSDSADNVWVDAIGRLHLKITKSQGGWNCAEVISQRSLGYGTYRFYLDSDVSSYDPNVVVGLFTWSDDPAYHNREIDIEFSRWGDPNGLNAQYTVQPYTDARNYLSFQEPAGYPQTTHSFTWSATSVSFRSLIGYYLSPLVPNYVIKQWTGTHDVPAAGGENARINFWLMSGLAPGNGKEAELIVNRFEFVPGAP